jgi:hypothetical protein
VLQDLGLAERKFPLDITALFTGDYQCFRLFSLLLGLGCGQFLQQFYISGVHDKTLHQNEREDLRENLISVRTSPIEVDRIIHEFRSEKWAYCPLEIEPQLNSSLSGTRVVIPFCKKIRLGDKGGTASLYWVAVQQDLIHDKKLRAVLEKSLYVDREFGQVR